MSILETLFGAFILGLLLFINALMEYPSPTFFEGMMGIFIIRILLYVFDKEDI